MSASGLRQAFRLPAAVLLAAVLCAPAAAVTIDPRIGTPEQLAPTPEQTQEQVNEQMKNRKVYSETASDEVKAERDSELPELPSGQESQALRVVTGGDEQDGKKSVKHAQDAPEEKSKPNQMLALAITAGILGLICMAAMLAVKKGPPPPNADA